MRKLFQAAVLILCLSSITVSCTKTNPSSSISGTWKKAMKGMIIDNPTETDEFVSAFGYVVFSGNTVYFKDWDNKVIREGAFTYSVSETSSQVEGTVYRGTISFSGLPLKGGNFTRTVLKDGYAIPAEADSIEWTDESEGYHINLRHLP